MVATALFVCSVDSTRCPVSDASIAVSSVSPSRISPTMITSGSWRSTARSPFANVNPALSLVCPWFTPGSAYSTGIFDGDDVLAGVDQLRQRGVQRGRLAAAGRTGDEHDAFGPVNQVAHRVEHGAAHADPVEPPPQPLLSSRRRTAFSPWTVG